MIVNVVCEARPDGGVCVWSTNLPGLILSGLNRVRILAAIEPAARAILDRKGIDTSNLRIDAQFTAHRSHKASEESHD